MLKPFFFFDYSKSVIQILEIFCRYYLWSVQWRYKCLFFKRELPFSIVNFSAGNYYATGVQDTPQVQYKISLEFEIYSLSDFK